MIIYIIYCIVISLKFGWFNLSDLGKPFFTISGSTNFSVDDAVYGQYYQLYGLVSATNASVQWEIIPSGYPGYSATGVFTGQSNYSMVGVKWDNHPGFAALKCTATTQCGTVVNYFSVHIY